MRESDRASRGVLPDSPAPGSMGRLLAYIGERIDSRSIDRIWLFPPLVRGRKEWGLVAVSCLTDDPGQRTLVTARYVAELTGQGIVFQAELASEGSAPPERLPRIMDGVVSRSDLQLGVPKELEIGGDLHLFHQLELDYGPGDEDPPVRP